MVLWSPLKENNDQALSKCTKMDIWDTWLDFSGPNCQYLTLTVKESPQGKDDEQWEELSTVFGTRSLQEP
eukprot:10644582-Prorocentrum_lima.AAC.1